MMRLTLIMAMALAACVVVQGCAPLGGQAVVAYAKDEAQVNMYVYIIDGGTDLGGLFYRPSGGTLVRGEQGFDQAMQPPKKPEPTTQPTTQPSE